MRRFVRSKAWIKGCGGSCEVVVSAESVNVTGADGPRLGAGDAGR